ncbi:hypothetical protein PQQ96_19770 [Paraburkholderia sediminicola]|uniref:hypothetical protein n=1 Tax=Paraburkholderia sediminicola TaxID=458836 RepID=UPI0038B7FF61
MNPSQFDARDSALDAEVEAQLCAYNSAFDELGLRFRWDAHTLASLALIDGEEARIAAYIEVNHAHLLNAYSAGFLARAILERKNARYPACLTMRVEIAPHLSDVDPQSKTNSRREHMSYEIALPALAGV